MPVRPYDQNKQFLLPPALNEWLRKDHPARVFSDIIDRLDISGFQEIKSEGRPRFDIRMMLKVLLWAYANGVRASRKIEEKLHSDVVFMWLAGLEKPDFRTVCLFRQTNLERLNYLFSEVIVLAKALGLIRLGLIALDGTKIRANAAVDSFKKVKDWSEDLTNAQAEVHRILAEAEAADLADDKQYGNEFRGDEIPLDLERVETRIKKIEKLMSRVKTSEKTDDNRVSSTDPEASFMHHKGWSIPAYNAELAVTEEQLIVYSDVTTEPVDTNQLVPALEGIKETCGNSPRQIVADAGFNSGKNLSALEQYQVDGYIAEGGEKSLGKTIRRNSDLYSKENFKYDKEQDCYICPAGKCLLPAQQSFHQSKYSQQEGVIYRTERDVCLTCNKKSQCTQSDNSLGRSITRTPYETMRMGMREKLKSKEGRLVYKKRKTIVEPVIGQVKMVGGFIQFLLRGIIGAKVEWKWATIAHNLLKLTRLITREKLKLASAVN